MFGKSNLHVAILTGVFHSTEVTGSVSRTKVVKNCLFAGISPALPVAWLIVSSKKLEIFNVKLSFSKSYIESNLH